MKRIRIPKPTKFEALALMAALVLAASLFIVGVKEAKAELVCDSTGLCLFQTVPQIQQQAIRDPYKEILEQQRILEQQLFLQSITSTKKDEWCNARRIAGFGYNEVLERLDCR